MDTILFACLAGAAFGALNVAILHGLRARSDIAAGTFVVMLVALPVVGLSAVLGGHAADFPEPGLWAFLLIGALVPGTAQLVGARAVSEAGASRAGVVLGTSPAVSALIAIVAFGEPIRAGLVAGTALIVVGGIGLAWEPRRPTEFARLGLLLALLVAVAFGVRDNAVRWTSGHVAASPQAAAAFTFAGAVLVVGLFFALTDSPDGRLVRVRLAAAPFLPAGILTALGTIFLFEAFDRGRVTVAAPLVATAVLWTVVFAALFFGSAERLGPRVVAVAVVILAGGVLIGITR